LDKKGKKKLNQFAYNIQPYIDLDEDLKKIWQQNNSRAEEKRLWHPIKGG